MKNIIVGFGFNIVVNQRFWKPPGPREASS